MRWKHQSATDQTIIPIIDALNVDQSDQQYIKSDAIYNICSYINKAPPAGVLINIAMILLQQTY